MVIPWLMSRIRKRTDKSLHHRSLPAQAQEREIPLDTRLLSDAVIELNISRKNVSIYPPATSRSPKASIAPLTCS